MDDWGSLCSALIFCKQSKAFHLQTLYMLFKWHFFYLLYGWHWWGYQWSGCLSLRAKEWTDGGNHTLRTALVLFDGVRTGIGLACWHNNVLCLGGITATLDRPEAAIPCSLSFSVARSIPTSHRARLHLHLAMLLSILQYGVHSIYRYFLIALLRTAGGQSEDPVHWAEHLCQGLSRGRAAVSHWTRSIGNISSEDNWVSVWVE